MREKAAGLLADEAPIAEIDEFRSLIAEGQERGYLTFDEIASTLEEVEVTKEQVQELHAHLEEKVFYPAYAAMTGKNGTQLVADSRLAHTHVRELMSELQGLERDEAAFEVKFHDLMGIVREHVAEEENMLFPEAEQILADQLEDLMDHMVELKHHLTSSPQQ